MKSLRAVQAFAIALATAQGCWSAISTRPLFEVLVARGWHLASASEGVELAAPWALTAGTMLLAWLMFRVGRESATFEHVRSYQELPPMFGARWGLSTATAPPVKGPYCPEHGQLLELPGDHRRRPADGDVIDPVGLVCPVDGAVYLVSSGGAARTLAEFRTLVLARFQETRL